jgi:hypothetical protein
LTDAETTQDLTAGHPVPDEDPEAHIGPVVLDPWDDEGATDWPNETVDLAEDEEV